MWACTRKDCRHRGPRAGPRRRGEAAAVPGASRDTTSSVEVHGQEVPPGGVGQADGDYKQITADKSPTASIVGGSDCSSFVNEPSVSNNGKHWFVTGNWYAGYSHD